MTDLLSEAVLVIQLLGLVLAFLVYKSARTKMQSISVQIDGRLTQLLEQTAKASHAEGVISGTSQPIVPMTPQVPA